MRMAVEIRRRLRQAIGPLLSLVAVTYLVYHAVEGDRGLLAWWRLNHDIRTAEAMLADQQRERDTLERRSRLLRPDSLDPDMLEERARAMADLGHDDELLILRQTPSR